VGLIKNSETHSLAQSAVVLDLGDLSRQADAIRAKAERDADAIIAGARKEREALVLGGREQGFEEGRKAGYKDGLQRGLEEGRAQALEESAARLSAIESAWMDALGQFEGAREQMLEQAGDQILKVAALCAERVTKRCVELDEDAVAAQMEAVLKITSHVGRLVLRIHPEDEAVAREALPDLLARLGRDVHAEIVTDASISRGSCVAKTASGGEVDASIDTQLRRVIDVLLPPSDRHTTQEDPFGKPDGDDGNGA